MEIFAERYHEDNPGVFSCSETAWVLSFGLMILNTDMYNRNIKVSQTRDYKEFSWGIGKGWACSRHGGTMFLCVWSRVTSLTSYHGEMPGLRSDLQCKSSLGS